MRWSKIGTAMVLVAGLLILMQPTAGLAKMFVVATTLDMADFARQVGGERVEVYAVSTGKVDLHFFEPVPSQAMKLGRAKVLVVGGLEIDAWVQGLIEASRNAKIMFGAPGYVDPAVGVRPLDVPAGSIDGSMGDVHPYGNPHFWYTPENVRIAVRNITDGLVRVDPEGAAVYEENRDRYLARVQATFEALKAKMRPFQGTAVLQYHESWNYFCEAMGLEIVGTLEPKPGIPPTPGHLKHVVEQARARQAKLLLVEPYYPKRPVRFVEEKAGVKALRLPLFLGGTKGIDDYLENLEYIVEAIVSALARISHETSL